MTNDEFIDFLVERKALIVHCSRPGNANESIGGLLFPEVLRNATKICPRYHKELSCSVIWLAHVETFGDLGIVLRPRSIASITSISAFDAGSHYASASGKREGEGAPFCGSAVRDTFETAMSYNEWTVTDADTVGIFINPNGPLQVAKVVDATKMSRYNPSLMLPELVTAGDISISEIVAALPGLPVYSYRGHELIEIVPAGARIIEVTNIYRQPDQS